MEGLTLSQIEQARIQVLNEVLEGRIGVKEAAQLMGVSERHTWRLVADYRKEGAKAIAHGNRGRRPAHAIREETRVRIVKLVMGPYGGVNHSHLTELLAEREGIEVSRSTVRRVLEKAGIRSPRRRRAPKHRSRRERRAQEGMLLQVDGSKHDWLEGRGPHLTLVAGIDDATGTVPHAVFRREEDTQGYMLLIRDVMESKGIPLALYSDRHGIFQRSEQEKETLEEQLSGERGLTQFGRAMRELGIGSIYALSPQAKGRIERLFETLQDRLVVELRLAGASTEEEASRVLEAFLPKYNARFGVPARQPGSAYREVPKGLDIDRVLCFKYWRKVGADNTVQFDGRVLQLLPGRDRMSYAHAKVELQERLDGSLVVWHRGLVVASAEAPPHPVTLRARNMRRSPGSLAPSHPSYHADQHPNPSPDTPQPNPPTTPSRPPKPGPDHPWRRPLLTKSLNT
jgi:transposase